MKKTYITPEIGLYEVIANVPLALSVIEGGTADGGDALSKGTSFTTDFQEDDFGL